MAESRPQVSPVSARRRPADRREQIATTAAALFSDLGYHRVSIGDIASAVGVTGRAIYRHFHNKHDLLVHTISEGLDRIEVHLRTAGDPNVGRADAFAETVRDLAGVIVDHRYLGVLVLRESRHLEAVALAQFERRYEALLVSVQDLVQGVRRDLDPADSRILAESAMAVLMSPSEHSATTTRQHGIDLLCELVSTVVHSHALPRDVTAPARAGDPAASVRTARASRREELLAAAIDLFAAHGYSAARMEDLGAAVGIAGPSIYEHFPSKVDVLMAALNRGAEWLQYGLGRALGAAGSSRDRLELVLRSYVAFGLEEAELMRVFLTESIYLPDEQRHQLRRIQREYVAEWVRLVREVRPESSEADAYFATHAALAIANDLVRTGLGPSHLALSEVVISIGMELMVGPA